MSNHRRAAKVDKNQNDIVGFLRKIPGVSVDLNHNDFLIGYRGKTYWIELKSADVVSKKTGKILESGIKESQKKLLRTWNGHYAICATLEQILNEIGING